MTPASGAPMFTEGERRILSALAEALIPGGDGLPAAPVADVHGKWIDRVFAVRPDLVPAVTGVIDQYGSEPPRLALQRCRAAQPALFDDLTLAVSGAYFMNPRVRKTLGYPGNAPKRRPAYPDESDFYLDDGALLEPVIARGPIYRPTPDSEPRG